MGGNALKGIAETRRFARDEYFALENDVTEKLKKVFPFASVSAVVAYKNKDSFGDMDVLFYNPEPVHWPRYLTQLFETKGYTKNGGVTSFEYRGIQVDLIMCSSQDEYSTSMFYFAYNDLGNFMGRIAHKMGFKYGHRGLTFVVKDGDYQFDEIVVSQNPADIMRFLGYDYSRFLSGFNELTDVFEYAASTPFFNKDIFLLHNRNHTSRVRDAKRKSYNAFLSWMEVTPNLRAYEWQSMEERGGTREVAEFMKRAFEFFPEFEDQYQDVMTRFDRHRQAKARFNGDLVREWTGLEGKELGEVMKRLRDFMMLDYITVTDYVLAHSDEFLRKVVLNAKCGPLLVAEGTKISK